MLLTYSRCSVVALLLSASLGLTACSHSASVNGVGVSAATADEQAVRAARMAQNQAIKSGDVDRVAEFWTEDVEIRRGLGTLIVGRDAYRKLWVISGDPDSALVYQREPATISISSAWPLAYESGTWAGHLGGANGPAVIGGSYAAQWVKRDGRWLIRGEVFVALTCAGRGCAYTAVP
jgi:ketosteroid isomerase-like protein